MDWVDPLQNNCSWKPLWLGMGEVLPAALTSPTLHPPIPSHCAEIILLKRVPMHQLSWLALQELKGDNHQGLLNILFAFQEQQHFKS